VSFVLTQQVVNASAWAELRRSQAARDAIAAVDSGLREDAAYEFVVAYFGLIQARLQFRLSQDHRLRMFRLWNWVSLRADGGGASGADKERIRGRMIAADSANDDAHAQYNQARITLERLTGQLESDPLLPMKVFPAVLPELPQALEIGNELNPSIVAAQANRRAAVYEQRVVLGRYLPKVSLEYSNSRTENAGGATGWKADQRLMLVATVSLLSGGADFHQQKAAASKEMQFQYEELDSRRTLEQSLQIAYSGITAAHTKLVSLRRQLKADEKVVAAFDLQLKSGSRSLLDVFDAYQQYGNTRSELLRTSVSAVLLHMKALRTMGKLENSLLGSIDSLR
jgi:adhesin transport system outer membrane protein